MHSRELDQALGLCQIRRQRLLHQDGDFGAQELGGHGVMICRGNGQDRGVDELQQRPMIAEGKAIEPGGHGLGLVGIGVGDRDQLDVRHALEDAGVLLA